MLTKIRIYGLALIGLFIAASGHLSAQKVKYKDLFPLLNASDFENGERFLRRFVEQEPDFGNAMMYMGRMYEYKYTQLDILKETDLYTAYCDSAVLYFRKAYGLIDEKEIKKEDEYYQEFSRRDLRTGKFGVKLADVQFKLEEEIEENETRSNNARSLRKYFDMAENNYSMAVTAYNGIVDKYSSITPFLMKSTDADLDSLKKIGNYYDQFSESFENYKNTLVTLGNAGYDQKLTTRPIEDFVKIESPDFFSNEIVVYNFKAWSDGNAKSIVEDIRPMKQNMAEYDRQLDGLYDKAVNDSQFVENDLATLTEKMFFEQLNNYDPDPLPSLIFNFKVDEITYYSYLNHIYQQGSLDTSNIDLRLDAYKDLYEKFGYVRNSYSELIKVNIDEKAELYADFITSRFGGVDGLSNYITGKNDEVNNVRVGLENKIEELFELGRWGIAENDSIPLFTVDSINFNIDESKFTYSTLSVDTIETGYIAVGLRYNSETMENFAARVGYDRTVDTLYHRPLSAKIEMDSINSIQGYSKPYDPENPEEKGFIYVFQINSGNTTNYEMSNLLIGTGVKWSSTFENPYSLMELNVDTNTHLIVLKMGEIVGDVESERENLVFNFEGKLLITGGN